MASILANRNKAVLLIILLKAIILALFSSAYSVQLFQPFVRTFVAGHLNPWQYYYTNGLNLDSFPYHGLMLYLLAPFMWIIQVFTITNILVTNFLFKLPLLIADLSLLLILFRLFPTKPKQVIVYYFLNPIIIYAIYIYAQLDIIPMALLMIGIYFISIERYRYSAVFVGFALAAKFHVLIVLPLIYCYLMKKQSTRQGIMYIIIVLGTILLFDLPFVFSDGFIHMVLLNSRQALLFDSYYAIGKLELLLPIAAIFIVYFHFLNQRKVNHDLLFSYLGVLFTAIIFFINPAPGWYVWITPFISIYFIQNDIMKKSKILYMVLSLTYLVFFLFFYQFEYQNIYFIGRNIDYKLQNPQLLNGLFTFLESILLAIMYAFYKYGIKSNSLYKRKTNIAIGIGGDSGCGKSSLLANLTLLLGNKLLQIEGDGEHKWERGNQNWSKFTHLDPKANNIHRQADAIYELKHNNPIFRSEYDHDKGTFTSPLKLMPREFLAISGLHPFYLPKIRKLIDLKIYLDTEDSLRRHWKIIRDIKKRGYDLEKIVQQIDNRKSDAAKYIATQKPFADLVVHFYSIEELKIGDENHELKLGLKLTLDASIHLEELLNQLDVEYIWDYNQDLHTQFIELNNEPDLDFRLMANNLITNLNEIVSVNSSWKNGYAGFIQLIILMMISEKLKEDI